MTHRDPRRVVILALLAAAIACDDEPPMPPGPAAVAQELFELAGQGRPADESLNRMFGPDADSHRRAALGDALEQLGEASEPCVLGQQSLEAGDRRVVVDLEADLPGEGSARFSVVLEQAESGWRVTWFQGPGVEWPPSRRRKGQGLSTSPPPGPTQVR